MAMITKTTYKHSGTLVGNFFGNWKLTVYTMTGQDFMGHTCTMTRYGMNCHDCYWSLDDWEWLSRVIWYLGITAKGQTMAGQYRQWSYDDWVHVRLSRVIHVRWLRMAVMSHTMNVHDWNGSYNAWAWLSKVKQCLGQTVIGYTTTWNDWHCS